ncbi:MAG: hypothetical protein V1767_08860 [Chloroflexota bacterium]
MNGRKWLILLLAIVTVTSLITYAGVTSSMFVDDEHSTNDALGIRWGLFTLNDGFEGATWDDLWNENGTTTWVRSSTRSHSGTYSALSDSANKGYLTSDEIEASTASNVTVSFWFYPKNLNAGDVFVQTYNGTAYNTWYDITSYPTYSSGSWCQFNQVITDSQYKIAGFRLRFDSSAVGGSRYFHVDDVVITTDTVPPSVPTGLSATGGGEQISLNWNDNGESDLWGYNVYRSSVSGGPYSKINTSPVPNSAYTDTGLYGGGTYYYVVRAVDYGNNESGNSGQASGTATNVAPVAPTSVNATAGNETISLSWNANTEPDLSGYNVYRSLTSGGSYSQINGSLVTSSNYTNTGLYGGGTYYYKVTAVDNVSAESGFSNIANANAANVAPSAPTGLTATPGNEQISLDWNDNVETDIAGYNVYRSTISGGPYSKINGSLVTSSNYTNTGLYGGGTYYYVVRAQDNGSLESGNSNQASATATNIAPAAPTGLAATPGNEQISLDWNDNVETDIAGYNVYRGTVSGGPYSKINGSLVTSSNYTNTGLYSGGIYYYVVRAQDNGSLESGNSNQASATATNIAPAAPTGLAATPGAEQIILDWNDNIETDLSGYNVYRGTVSGGPYSKINGSLVTSSNYTNTGLYGGGTYYYVVTAADNVSAESGYSGQASATASNAAPSAPTGLTATPGAEQISLDWNDNTEPDIAGYNVYRGTVSGGPYSKINGSLVTSSNYTNIQLYGGGTYYYVVRAQDNGSAESGNSNEANATATNVAPSAPTGLTATPGDGSASLNWNDNIETDLAGYNVYRGTVSGNYTKINGSLVTSSNYTDSGLTGGITYYYVVRAQDNGSLESGNSNESSATPVDNPPAAPTGLTAYGGNQKVTLDWNDNTEPDLAGYNVYRGTVSGNYTKINGSLVSTSNYTDSTVTSGTTYYYAVKAVDLGSHESGYSNEDNATPWTASLWTQTSQADFEAGVSTNVSTIASTGNVVLAAGGNAGGANMILFWDGGTAPSGWTIVSNVGGDFYQRFPRGEATYGGTGGSDNNTHTATFSITSAGNGSVSISSGAGGGATDIHTHTLASNTINTGSSLPVYRNLQVIKYNSGVPTTIPTGAIAIFDGALPAGWTRLSAEDNYYVRGEATANATGGSANHTHTVSIVTNPTANTATPKTGGTTTYATNTHTHSQVASTSVVSNQPPYRTVVLAKADNITAIPVGMIAMFDASPTGSWSVLSNNGGDFYQKLLIGGSTYGASGGSDTHNHSNQTVTLSTVTGTASNGKQTGTNYTSATHTHTVDITAYSTVSSLPPYINVVFAKAMYYSSGTIASQVLDTNVTGSEWTELSWDRTLPSGTSVTFEVRASDTLFLKDAASPSWTSVGGTSPVTSGLPSGRYKQWRAILTSDGTQTSTPTLQEVRVYYHGN